MLGPIVDIALSSRRSAGMPPSRAAWACRRASRGPAGPPASAGRARRGTVGLRAGPALRLGQLGRWEQRGGLRLPLRGKHSWLAVRQPPWGMHAHLIAPAAAIALLHQSGISPAYTGTSPWPRSTDAAMFARSALFALLALCCAATVRAGYSGDGTAYSVSRRPCGPSQHWRPVSAGRIASRPPCRRPRRPLSWAQHPHGWPIQRPAGGESAAHPCAQLR